jgi:ribonuclease HII
MASRVVREIDQYERRLRAVGFALIAGTDEAGRGALAGPMLAAAVILPEGFDCSGLRDSKALTAIQRDEWYERITAEAVAFSVARAFPRRIDHRGLHVSNLKLLRQALNRLPVAPDFVLSDGFRLRGIRCPDLAVKKGDEVCASVAAASIVAKVTRDRIMTRYHRRFPVYGWAENKGYGTPGHREAIAEHGPSPIHRLSFKGLKMYMEEPGKYQAIYGRGSRSGAVGDEGAAEEESP